MDLPGLIGRASDSSAMQKSPTYKTSTYQFSISQHTKLCITEFGAHFRQWPGYGLGNRGLVVHFPATGRISPLRSVARSDQRVKRPGREANTRILQLPMLRISGSSCVLTVPKQQVLLLPYLPQHGDTSCLRNALRFLARDDRQATKKIRHKYCQIPSSEYVKPS
jgi:hypothetical protein